MSNGDQGEPLCDWTLPGLSEEDMGALSLALQVRQHLAAEPWETERWARIVEAVRQAINQEPAALMYESGRGYSSAEISRKIRDQSRKGLAANPVESEHIRDAYRKLIQAANEQGQGKTLPEELREAAKQEEAAGNTGAASYLEEHADRIEALYKSPTLWGDLHAGMYELKKQTENTYRLLEELGR
ncbi:hypothetical protein [Streptomyces sp. CFMR 7]|uniref:hypothetical protein n=1 Tax=Streptomyces sp. CFMR 7 TaxID=1649184 RepID=UPI0011A73B06|nr:hypothetical protein [Streptomyces sp. CFMR 7]